MSGLGIDPRYRPASVFSPRAFVDRKGPLALFKTLLDGQRADDHRIVNYYGIGGIGKSRLQRELLQEAKGRKGSLAVSLDLQVPALRRQEAALASMRYTLGAESKVQLHLFDIAYAFYWQRTHPNVRMTARELPLINESEILGDIVQVAGELPFVQAAIGFIKGVHKVGKHTQHWRRVRRDDDLKRLDELDTSELLDALTFFFARDLRHVLSEKPRRGVFFIDSHEALWEDLGARGGHGPRDGWLRDLIAQTPGILWVICSREALDWHREDPRWHEPYLQACPIGDLSDPDRLLFLNSCGIDGAVARAIADASAGVPFYLNVSVDHWQAVSKERHPGVKDFGTTQADLLSRFIGHLPSDEEEVLRVLSVARTFDRPLLEHLLRTFNIGYPLSRWDDFCHYSFNRRTTGHRWLMHELMRQEIQRRLSPELRTEVHRAIFEFERERCDTASLSIADRAQAFREAVLHGVKAHALDPDWFMRSLEFLMYRGRWRVIAPAIEEMGAALQEGAGSEGNELLRQLHDFAQGWIYRQECQLADSKRLYDGLDSGVLSPWAITVGFQTANTIREAGDLAGAGAMYEQMWKQPLPSPQQIDVQRLAGIQFADYQQLSGNFRKAVEVLSEVMAGLDEETDSKILAEAIRIRGHVERFNELPGRGRESYLQAGALFERCDDLFGQAIVQTNLAEAGWAINPAEAVEAGFEAVRANQALGSRLEVGKAHVALAYARLLLGEGHDALRHANEAVEIQEAVGYLGGAAHARLCRGWVLGARGRTEEAIEDLARSSLWLAGRAVYPTLQMLARHGAVHFGAVELVRQLRESTPVHWLTSSASGEARIAALAQRLVEACGPPVSSDLKARLGR